MALTAGARLGPYEILAPLGVGGMGEVYRALDPRLGREVAVKILPAALAHDSQMLMRFEQEARAAGSLNHPSIVALYDVGSDGGVPYVVSELLEGATLRGKLSAGALPARRAVDYAVHIAQGLAAAHERGIIHRDIKPENLFIVKDGRVKILDFGLAKVAQSLAREEAATGALAPADDLTPSGTILGTASYMSPEQVRGQSVDHRSDLFSFGAVLYEMLSGQRAFKGATSADTMTAILTREPAEIVTESGIVSPPLERIVRRCLEKDPDVRFQTAQDLAFALDTLSGVSMPTHPLTAGTGRRHRPWVAVMAGAAVLSSMAAGIWWERPLPEPVVVLRRLTADAGFTTDPALSPDGKLLAYASDRGEERNLDVWVQQMSGGEPLRLTRDPGDDHQPSFGPDGSQIAFRSERDGGGIYVIPALGGEERLLVRGGHWPRFSPDGTWIAYLGEGSVSRGLYVIPAVGGPPQEVGHVRAMAMWPSGPVWAPDGKHLLLYGAQVERDFFGGTLDWWLVTLPGPGAAPLTAKRLGVMDESGLMVSNRQLMDPMPFAWVGDRVVLAATTAGSNSSSLWALGINRRSFHLDGPPRRLTTGTASDGQASIDPQGRVVFSALETAVNLWELPIDANEGTPRGAAHPITTGLSTYAMPGLSEDGRRLVFRRQGTSVDVCIRDLATGKDVRLAVTPVDLPPQPVLSRDGARMLYDAWLETSKGKSVHGLYAAQVSGGTPDRLCEECGDATDWSRDGRKVLLQMQDNVCLLDLAAGGTVRTILAARGQWGFYRAHFSPDERFIVVHADRGATQTRIFIVPFPVPQGSTENDWIAVTDGASWDDAPRWSPDGRLLYYVSDRDGFRCIWAQRLDRTMHHLLGPPFSVQHFHGGQLGLGAVDLQTLDLAVAPNKLIVNLAERRGNIWVAESPMAATR